MSNPAILGVRDFNGERRLAMCIARRKDARDGRIATRPCFCAKNTLLPQSCCPIHVFGATVLRSAQPGGPIFHAIRDKNTNRILRAAFARGGMPEADPYSTHCVGRGAANGMSSADSILSEIMRVDGRSAKSFLLNCA